MANYQTLKAAIQAAIKQNGSQDITGNGLQTQLLNMINSLGAGYLCMGVATPTTNPGTPDQNVFYITGTPGTYTNFSNLVVADDEVAILKYDGSWSKSVTGAATVSVVTQLGQHVLNNFFTGMGQTYAIKEIYGLVPGRVYRIVLKSTSWDITGISGSDYYKFVLRNCYNNVYTILDGTFLTDSVSAYYDITIPTNSDFIEVGGRAVDGVNVEFNIYDITDIVPLTQKSKDITPLDEAVFGEEVPFSIHNGSQGNPGNPWVVTLYGKTTLAIPIAAGHKYRLVISKKPTTGYHYYYRIITYSTSSPSSLISNTVRNETSDWSKYYEEGDNIIITNATELGLSIQLTELTEAGATQSEGTCVALRAADFTERDMVFYDLTGIEEDLYKLKETEIIHQNAAIRQLVNPILIEEPGTSSSPVYIVVSNLYIRLYPEQVQTSQIKTTTIATDLNVELVTSPNGVVNALPIASGKILLYDKELKKFVLIDRTQDCTDTKYIFILSALDGAVTKLGDCLAYHDSFGIKRSLNSAISSLSGKVGNWRNGSPGNNGNTTNITSIYIPYHQGKKVISVRTNRPNTTGYHYVYGANGTYSLEDLGSCPVNASGAGGSGNTFSIQSISLQTSSPTITIPNNRIQKLVGVAIVLGESDGANWNPLRISDLVGYDFFVEFLDETPVAVISRNNDKLPMLINACRYHKTSATFKDYQVAICTDMHAWALANENAVAATNGIETIDAYVNCGDIVSAYYNLTQVAAFQSQFAKLSKPGYVVVGNHDVGNAYYVGYCCNHAQAYEAYIKPMVDAGVLANGEYEANKPYWYHDDTAHKIRLIGLYEYDDNLDFNETYWQAVDYDATKPAVQLSTTYAVGDIVNAGDYTGNSFKCVQGVTTPASFYTTPQMFPSYKVHRGQRVIRQTQAQWFLDTLAGTPAQYGVIVIMHNPFSLAAVSLDKKFSWPSGWSGADRTQTNMSTDLIRNAIVAFKNSENYSEKVVMSGNAAYLNVLNDGTIDYAYQVSKDFSQKNTGVYVLGLIGGHAHRDLIWKDATEELYQVCPNCAAVDSSNDAGGDVRRTKTDGIAADSLTVASFASGRVGLVKLGVNVTDRGTFRDYEVIESQ